MYLCVIKSHKRFLKMENLLLETQKKLNSAYARKNYKQAYHLLQIGNEIRAKLNRPILKLPNLEAKFN